MTTSDSTSREQEAELARGTQHLTKNDSVIGRLITAHGPYQPRPHSGYWRELVENIIGQQLSIKAAAAIERRFLEAFGGQQFPSAQQVLAKNAEELRAIGLSWAKARYILDLAQHVVDGRLKLDEFDKLSDAEIMRELTAVKGIGEWTAHMFLIFAMGRLNVLPTGDLGLRAGVKKLYGFEVLPGPAEVRQLAAKNHWHPYESIATWYIWQSITSASKGESSS